MWEAILDRLTAYRCAFEIRETAGPGAAENIARQASNEDFHAIVVAGGDGTINEAVNGLVGTDMPMAVIPLGTANVLAAEIGLSSNSTNVARTIISGTAKPAHLGLVNGRHFILMAGIGFDAHVVKNVRPQMKRRFGKGAYVLETLRALSTFTFQTYHLNLDGQDWQAASAIIANGHYYGGRFVCAPDASLDQTDLHCCLFAKPGRWNTMRYAGGLLTGTLGSFPDVHVVPARKIIIDGPPADPVQGDGDILAVLPATIQAAPQTINIIRP